MKQFLLWTVVILLVAAACGRETAVSDEATATDTDSFRPSSIDTERLPAERYDQYEIVTLLPRDAIPAIDDPQFISAAEADVDYDPDELVIGVEFNGDARAYSIPFLSRHEIVNDTVGGEKIAVTW